MTQAQLEDTVAGATGEPAYLIRGIGFGLVPCVLGPEDLGLCVACPFSRPGRRLPRAGGRWPAGAGECLRCDVYFDFAPDEVYAAGPARP